VLQGAVRPETDQIVRTFLDLPFVNNIVLSVFPGSEQLLYGDRVQYVLNEFLPNPGTGNRNLQILSSARGIQRVTTTFAVKMRTDQIIHAHSMQRMYDFWLQREQPDPNRRPTDTDPAGPLYVMGLYRIFPYHPRDHVFWGYTADLQRLWDCPMDPEPPNADYSQCTRAETYIGQWYYARYAPEAAKHAADPRTYLVDGAPCQAEALALDFEVRDRLFKVFPRVEMAWPKHNLPVYHYDYSAQFSEYWHEED
jgi:hypothetical protein